MSSFNRFRRVRTVFTSVITFAALALAGAGIAAPAVAAPQTSACTISDGTLTWGIKESFRSYISGTIAKGEWQTSDGATYDTPAFSWSDGEGKVDDTGAGEIAFKGAVTFTGHDGLLRTTFANPTIVFEENQPHLLIDVSGVSMEDALAGATDAVVTHTQVPLVALSLDTKTLPIDKSSQIAASDVPTTVTAEGYAAFSNYEEGSQMDPLSFVAQLDCTEPAAETPSPKASVMPLATEEDTVSAEGAPAAVWWGVGAGTLVVAGGVIFWALSRRRASDSGSQQDAL